MSPGKAEWTVLSMLEWATEYFEKQNISSPRLSIEWLLSHILEVKRLDLYLMYDRPLTDVELSRLRPLVKRRALHEPLQYITGFTHFMDCKIYVNSTVLIPRIETEQLIEELLQRTSHRKNAPVRLLDIGTGSGCIPVSIKFYNPHWDCSGCDISDEAVELARKNAKENNVHVTFFKCDLFDLKPVPEPDKWDIIISNPPYIPPEEKSSVEEQVIKYEPEIALIHEDPLSVYRAISGYAKQSLKHDGYLFLECNNSLASEIQEVVEHAGFKAETKQDLDKNPRFIIAGNLN
ncbi:MAG: peptide chain release factor N(5)-glutamine methyltransferase [Balneolaceae bacterium]